MIPAYNNCRISDGADRVNSIESMTYGAMTLQYSTYFVVQPIKFSSQAQTAGQVVRKIKFSEGPSKTEQRED